MLREDRHSGRQEALEAAPHSRAFTGALPGSSGLGGRLSPHAVSPNAGVQSLCDTERLRSNHANPQDPRDGCPDLSATNWAVWTSYASSSARCSYLPRPPEHLELPMSHEPGPCTRRSPPWSQPAEQLASHPCLW